MSAAVPSRTVPHTPTAAPVVKSRSVGEAGSDVVVELVLVVDGVVVLLLDVEVVDGVVEAVLDVDVLVLEVVVEVEVVDEELDVVEAEVVLVLDDVVELVVTMDVVELVVTMDVVVLVVVDVVVTVVESQRIVTLRLAASTRAHADPMSVVSRPKARRAAGAVRADRTRECAPMRTVAPATFSTGAGVPCAGPSRPSLLKTTSPSTLIVDCPSPATSMVACLPARISQNEYTPPVSRRVVPFCRASAP
jgi:hypothetical protein